MTVDEFLGDSDHFLEKFSVNNFRLMIELAEFPITEEVGEIFESLDDEDIDNITYVAYCLFDNIGVEWYSEEYFIHIYHAMVLYSNVFLDTEYESPFDDDIYFGFNSAFLSECNFNESGD